MEEFKMKRKEEKKMKRYDGSFTSSYTYKGLVIHAARGVHERVMQEIERLVIKKASKILVLGSGQGAFEQRLIDKGYKNITTIDTNKRNFKCQNKNITFHEMDLNSDFSKRIKESFQLIIALEIIEHLESPAHFLKECERKMRKDGILIISTPNLHNTQSRINTLLFGYPNYFIVAPEKYDHISPIYDNIITYLIKEKDLQCIKRIGTTSYFSDFKIYGVRSILYYMLMRLLTVILSPLIIFNRQLKKGVSVIYTIRKAR